MRTRFRALVACMALCTCVYPKINADDSIDASGGAGGSTCKISVSAGSLHTCAVDLAGAVYCWGYNDVGQVGIGTPGGTFISPLKTKLVNEGAAVALGIDFSCALTFGGNVHCWGSNNLGQLAAGSDLLKSEPTPVPGINGVLQVAAGGDHVCTLRDDGEVWCWGYNDGGAVGVPSDGGVVSIPTRIPSFGLAYGQQVEQLAAGRGHTCARTLDGAIWCWGYNNHGQLGNASNAGSSSPIEITTIDHVIVIAAGEQHTCAIKNDTSLWCWGRNDFGQIGTGSSGSDALTPQPVAKLGVDVTAVAAGPNHTCAITTDRQLRCWGDNSHRQLGDGTTNPSSVPVAVMTDVVEVTAGGAHTCARKLDGKLWCWGWNNAGQTGTATTLDPIVTPIETAEPMYCPRTASQ